MVATPKQRVGLTLASLVIGHGFMAASHQGMIGAILATAGGMAAWMYADDVFDKLNTGEHDAPPTRGRRKRDGLVHRLFTTREQRESEGRQWLMADEEDDGDDDEDDGDFEMEEEDEQIALEEDDGSIKTFRQLLADGTIMAALKRREMVLGYVDGQLRTVPIKYLYSCGIGGLSGTGKSTTVRLLLFQFALLKARLVLIDPHIEDKEESLAESFKGFRNIHALPPCGEDANEIAKRIRILMHEYERRKKHGIKGPPLMLVIDELNGLMRRLPAALRLSLSHLILTLEGEARKFGMCCVLIGQRWSEQDLGGKPHGAAIRDSLATCLAHRFQSEDQAKKLIGSQYGRQCLSLRNGHYLFRDHEGEVCHIYTPNTLASDAVLVQKVLNQRERERAEATVRVGEHEVIEEQATGERAEDAVEVPESAVQTGPLEDAAQEAEQVHERPVPVIRSAGPRAEDIDLAAAITLWNNGYNSVRKLMRVFPGMTLHQAHRLSQMIEDEAQKRDE